MKQFDWEKHPDIDVVAWDKNGECRGYTLNSVDMVKHWAIFNKKLPEYDIDPNTEGFDWTKSKQVRPNTLVPLDIEYKKFNERIAELEKQLANEKLIDFCIKRYEFYLLNATHITAKECAENVILEVNILSQAIERIENGK